MSATLLTNRPLAASESFTQAIRDRFNDREPIGAVRALIYADQAGTLYLEESDDEGENYTATATVSVSAATTTELAWTALTKRWYRFRYANSTTAQTNFRLIQQTMGMGSLPAGASLLGKVVPVDADGDEKFTDANPGAITVTASFPSQATPFCSTADSEANTAKTITIAAVEGKSHYITAIEVSISGAAAVSTITVTLKEDAAGTPVSKWKEIIGIGASIGTRVGLALPFPIKLTAGKTADLVISAGGASVVTTGNIAGYTL